MGIRTELTWKWGSPILNVGKRKDTPSTCAWQNPHADCKGLFQGDVGNLADVSGTFGAWLSCHHGRNAVGSHHALSGVGEGGTRDLGWNSTQLLSNPCHYHILRIVASNVADEGG